CPPRSIQPTADPSPQDMRLLWVVVMALCGVGSVSDRTVGLDCWWPAGKTGSRSLPATGGDSVGDSVLTEIVGGVAVITIDRPEARNAVDRTGAEGLAAAIDELEERSDAVIGILTGAGGTFCAGMDLKAFTRGERPSIPGRGFGGVTERPPSKPLIAAV